MRKTLASLIAAAALCIAPASASFAEDSTPTPGQTTQTQQEPQRDYTGLWGLLGLLGLGGLLKKPKREVVETRHETGHRGNARSTDGNVADDRATGTTGVGNSTHGTGTTGATGTGTTGTGTGTTGTTGTGATGGDDLRR